jgi:uncharacterized protein (TIGR02453 family)
MPSFSPSNFEFLTDLQANNTREWFGANKARYDAAHAEVLALAEALIQGFGQIDPDIAKLKAKDTTFRIYRDTRFSHNKAPYKNNMSIYLNKGGKKSAFAGYYFHFQPGASFMAGGCWMPPSDKLAAIRQEIDYNGAEFRAIVGAAAYTDGLRLEGERLKTTPKGYAADHPEIEFLKMKSFIATRSFTDGQFTAPDLGQTLLGTCQTIKPLVDFLNRAIGA